MSIRTSTIIGEVFLSPLLLLLLSFTLGEILSGDLSGLQHILQLLPLLVIGVYSWFFPRRGGFIILLGSIILFCVYIVGFTQFPLSARLFNAAMIFSSPLIASYFFIKTRSLKG